MRLAQFTEHRSARHEISATRPRSYVVRDANDQSLAYVYSRATENEALQAKALTEDEARRIAINIARCRARTNAASSASTASC